jgi:maleylpyruvate isomerase
MRVREIWIHCVDLDVGTDFGDHPLRINHLLLDSVVDDFSSRTGFPPLTLAPTDAHTQWLVGTGSGSRVQGNTSQLLGWLIGRSSDATLEFTPGDPLPTIPIWL